MTIATLCNHPANDADCMGCLKGERCRNTRKPHPGFTLSAAKGEQRIRKLQERIRIEQEAIAVHQDHITIMEHEIAQLQRDMAVIGAFDEDNPAHLLRLVDCTDKGAIHGL